VGAKLARGRVEIGIAVEVTSPPEREVVVDESLIAEVSGALAGLRARGLVVGGLSAADVLRLPQALEVRAKPASATAGVPASVTALVHDAVGQALDALVTMRETEGQFIAKDLDARLATIASFVTTLEEAAIEGQRQLEVRLRERVASLPPDLQGDPAAIAQEVVRFVSRSDVDEEVVRMRAHLAHWRVLADGPEPCGRKLDFLVQEMNREINTMGSKAEGTRATEVVIAAKAELERIKEQVQNVE
jgi:uncharacterized protein (TIGR00255 family)